MTVELEDKLSPDLNRATRHDPKAVVVEIGAAHVGKAAVGWAHRIDCAQPLVEHVKGFRSKRRQHANLKIHGPIHQCSSSSW